MAIQYTENFYEMIRDDSEKSARTIVKLVLELTQCKRVIDVGCGDGAWLKVFKENGIQDILGVDGDYVNPNILAIPKEQFFPFDLTKPLRLDRQFDLVVSLEVAEHLPPESAEAFIDSLTSLGPVILFSAAIPHQPGDYHINTQWLDYWVKLFQKRDYVAIDCIRPKIWNNKNVAYYFAQNILFFVETSYLEKNSLLKSEFEKNGGLPLPLVHPTLYLQTNY